MFRSAVPSLFLLILMSAIGSPASASQTGGPWRVGAPLPDLSLPTIDGEQEIALADLRGKRLLLIEFASW